MNDYLENYNMLKSDKRGKIGRACTQRTFCQVKDHGNSTGAVLVGLKKVQPCLLFYNAENFPSFITSSAEFFWVECYLMDSYQLIQQGTLKLLFQSAKNMEYLGSDANTFAVS